MRTEFERAYYVSGHKPWKPEHQVASCGNEFLERFGYGDEGVALEKKCALNANLAIVRMMRLQS